MHPEVTTFARFPPATGPIELRNQDGLVVKRAGKDAEGNWQIESEHPE